MGPSNNIKETSLFAETDEGFFCDTLDSIKNWTYHHNDSLLDTIYEDEPVFIKIKKEDTESMVNWTFDETDSEEDSGNDEDPELIQEERESKYKVPRKPNAMASILLK
jgi:hypothetical protein